MLIPREEQETVVTVGWNAETLTVSTTNPSHARQIERRGVTAHRVSRIDGEPVAWTYTCPASWFHLPRPKRSTSESMREKLSASAKQRAGELTAARARRNARKGSGINPPVKAEESGRAG